MTEPDLTSRATYTYRYQEKLRFSDTEMIGHINNVLHDHSQRWFV